MIFQSQKTHFKNQQLLACQRKIWDLEIRMKVQERFLEKVEPKIDSFKNEIEMIEEAIKALTESTKYEDRMTRKRMEEELAVWQQRLKEQEAEKTIAKLTIEGGQIEDKRIVGLQPKIDQIRETLEIIKEIF